MRDRFRRETQRNPVKEERELKWIVQQAESPSLSQVIYLHTFRK